MSHHVTATSANPTGAVEVVHVQSSAATSSPVDGGTATGGPAKPAFTPVAGESGARGANLPVQDIEQASNVIQSGKADLAQTAGAERRLDGFDGVGGGGGNDAVAQGTANENVSGSGLGGDQDASRKSLGALPENDSRSIAGAPANQSFKA